MNMKLLVDENGTMVVREVYNPIVLETNSGEKMAICMRDSGFELTYQGRKYYAQKGVINEPDMPDKVSEKKINQRPA